MRVAVEIRLRDLLAARASGSARPTPDVMGLERRRGLDPEQSRAAAAIASTDLLVVVEGAAGAGKTTMLGVAIEAAAVEGRATRVVTPTKKAADVAQQELGVATDSVAKLMHEHGWRWNRDGVWTRLDPGDSDPDSGAIYTGPSRSAQIGRGERIVVDEAGMLDQDTALALLTVADQHGVTLALVGDRAQLAAVGRGGVLDIAAQLSPRVFDMTTVHRFTAPEYADLTVRMRAGEHPALLFDRLHGLGLVVLHESTEALQEVIARGARDGDAITVATNDEARELNERIRAERVQRGEVNDTRTATGNDGLAIGAGDVIQTRKNDSDLQVANRQTWTVQSVGTDGTVWAKENHTGRKLQRTVRLPAEYLGEHTHLAYATTAYGVQGATVDESHTVLSDALDASGVYVGVTRGRGANHLHIVARDLDDAREQFVDALERDRADRGLTFATQAAREAIAGLVADGPVLLVDTERARLAELIEHAEQRAAKWERVVGALDRQAQEHQTETDEQSMIVAATEATAERVRMEVVTPLLEQSTHDGATYLQARARLGETSAAHRNARGLRKRGAARGLAAADEERRTIETATLRRWGSTPQTPEGIRPWAVTVAQQGANADPNVARMQERVDDARRSQQRLAARQSRERADLRRQVFGERTPSSPRAQASRWRDRAEAARRNLTSIEALPPVEAAELIRTRAEQEAARREVGERALAVRRARAAQLHDFTHPPADGGRTRLGRELGL